MIHLTDRLVTKMVMADSIKKRRLELGYQQKMVFNTIGVSSGTYSKYENIDDPTIPPLPVLLSLCECLDISLNDLFPSHFSRTIEQELTSNETLILQAYKNLSPDKKSLLLDFAKLLHDRS